ncbi:MAG: universal stress protein [bacterium]
MTHAIAYPAEHLAYETGQNEAGPVMLATKPFDGTDAPLAVARWLSHREDRELHVISVLDQRDALASAAGAPPLPPRFYDEERASIATRMLATLSADKGSDLGYKVDVLDGPCARTVVDVARERRARVIVVGTGKHDPIGRFVYGERALQIIRLADRPVLVVPRGASSGTIHRAIVAVDFSPVSLRAARTLIPMLSDGSTLTLVHVKPAEQPVHTSNELRCDVRFRRFIRLLSLPPTVTVETKLLWGDAAESVEQFAALAHADMIACGRRHNHSLVETLLAGSVSSALVRAHSCPVLIVPEVPDDRAAELNVVLTGIDTWNKDDWGAQLDEFTVRNRGRRVRFSMDVDLAGGGQCVAQDYVVRALSYDAYNRLVAIVLGDSLRTNSVLTLTYDDASAFTLYADVDGRDTRLVIETRTGRCTLTFTDDRGA